MWVRQPLLKEQGSLWPLPLAWLPGWGWSPDSSWTNWDFFQNGFKDSRTLVNLCWAPGLIQMQCQGGGNDVSHEQMDQGRLSASRESWSRETQRDFNRAPLQRTWQKEKKDRKRKKRVNCLDFCYTPDTISTPSDWQLHLLLWVLKRFPCIFTIN